MDVHFVPVEVGIVWGTYAGVHPEGPVWHDLDPVDHYGNSVKGRLPVEKDYVTVLQLSVDYPSLLDAADDVLPVFFGDLDLPSVGPCNVVYLVILKHFLDLGEIEFGYRLGDRKLPCYFFRDTDFVGRERRVWGYHGSGRVIDPLSQEVASYPPLFSFQSLYYAFKRSSRPVSCLRDSRELVVEIGGDMILGKLPEIVQYELGRPYVYVLLERLVYPHDVHQLVCQVIFGPLARFQRYAGPHGHGRYREKREYEPFGPAAPELYLGQVLVRHLFQPFPYGRGVYLVLPQIISIRLHEAHFLLLLSAVRAFLGGASRGLVEGFRVLAHDPAAFLAGRLEKLVYLLGIKHVYRRSSEFQIAEMAGTFADGSSACPAPETRIHDTHSGVHDSAVDRVAVSVVKVRGHDSHGRQ